ncbi:MAG: glycosyl hydrolase [Candidatus Azobacteroides sp.]|nr:glycosyl hydrolase [Candidatus Azobacteroides sp.]
MRKLIALFAFFPFAVTLFSQQAIPSGKGSYAEYPPAAVVYEDGYFAAPYDWFVQARPELNLHENVRNRPIPTNKWWTDFIFRGLGRTQPTVSQPPVTVTTTGDRFGSEAWAYPQVVTASAEGFNILFPKGFSGGGMNKGNPLKINATSVLQADDENILFTDFETATWPTGWTVSNNTQSIPGPMATAEITQTPRPAGYVGDRFVNTYKGDGARLTLISPKFTIQKNYIRLYVGGGNYPDATYVGLFINGTRVLSETGQNSGNLTQRTWEVSAYKGQEAEIRIVDDSGGGWGFIMCDEIIFTDSQFGGSGYTPDFRTSAAKVYDWTDLGFTLRSENDGKTMDAVIIHGVPFVYIEMNGLYPILVPGGTASAYDASGNKIETFPATVNAFTIEFDGRVYGIHAPTGSKVHQSKGGDFQLETPSDKRFVVVSALPDRSFLAVYDQYARNKPGNIRFDYEYKTAEGKIVTTFDMDAKNMETGIGGQETLMCFLSHHYRTTTKNFDFIPGADYRMFIGLMHTGAAKSFSLSYDFGGMPPYLPEPLDMPQERKEMLNSLLTYYSTHFGRNGNTYAKGLGEQSTGMLMAKTLNHSGFDLFKNGLKTEFADWFTFDEAERTQKSYYFAQYPDYGAVIGFPPGYGSQGFNDLHFHYGYFVVGAARLMMVDKEFKRDYSDMVKLIAQSYADWNHSDNVGTGNQQPFLRTFDPYLGHSFAGGTGDGGGNNQESTSEAINSWFGIYLLGVELNDKSIIDAGAVGYLLENISAGEYWLDLYGDNLPDTYPYDYVGILRTDNVAMATYFSGDPAWALGIQACPVDFYYTGFGLNPEKMTSINESMFKLRTAANAENYPGNSDPYENIKAMGPYLGGYLLNIMNFVDPAKAAQWLDEFCNDPAVGQEWRNHLNTATNYFLSNAMITYGKPARGYHTSIPSGAVYQNNDGELTYLLYNPTGADVDVDIYKDGIKIETVRVGAGVYYNSRMSGVQKPSVAVTSLKDGDKIASNKNVKVTMSASDKDGRVIAVELYFNGEQVGTSYTESFEVSFVPGQYTGTAELKAVAIDNDGNKSEPAVIHLTTIEQTPFNGTPWNVPSQTIYAVQFDEGGPEVACHDNEIGMQGGTSYRPGTGVETEGTTNIPNSNIGWTNTGEWYEYTINVQADGVYAMNARLGSANGGALRVFVDGEDLTGPVPVAVGSGWAFFDMFVANIPLKSGKRIMRVMIDRTGANLNSFKFTLTGNALPSEVDAGDDQVVRYPENNSATLTAVAVTYGAAVVTKYEWTQTDANPAVTMSSPDQPSVNLSNLTLGTYTFEVKITDSNGATAADNVAVLVRPGNFAPIAVPGSDRTINLGEDLMLDGSESVDPDGTIVKYEWAQTDVNSPAMILQNDPSDPTATVTGLEPNKLYIFRLTVTDNQNETGYANVRIFVAGATGSGDSFTSGVTIYPNPFVDRLIIQAGKTDGFKKLRVTTVTGSLVLEQNIQNMPVIEVNTSGLKRGYYILTLYSDKGIVSRKVVK